MNYLTRSFRKFLRVNRSYIIVFFACLAFQGFGMRANAQSSDKVKYYILYDVSGSVPSQDTFRNISVLLDRMIGHNSRDTSIASPVSFELILFGQVPYVTTKKLYDKSVNEADQAAMATLISEELNNIKTTKVVQQYTHLLSALDYVNSLDEEANQATFGVFIFTDGLLKPGDVELKHFRDHHLYPHDDSKAHSQYIEEIETTIDQLNKRKKPVFIVESAPIRLDHPKDLNDFYPTKEIEFRDMKFFPDTLRISNRLFWINSKVSLQKPENTSLLDYFDHFVIDAMSFIVNQVTNLPAPAASNAFIEKALFYDGTVENYKNMKQMIMSKEGTTEIATKALMTSEYSVSADIIGILESLEGDLKKTDFNRQQIEATYAKFESLFASGEINQVAAAAYQHAKENSAALPVTPGDQTFDSPKPTNLNSPEEAKQYENLEEAIVLGLADYLIERTQQEAYYMMYENLNNKLLKPIPYLKDTLFSHFSGLIGDKNFTPNIVLIKEAIQKDVELFPQNLIIHPRLREKEGLLALAYCYTLVDRLIKKDNLEEAFENVAKLLPDPKESITSFERGLLFTSEFIAFLKEHDLNNAYVRPTPEEMTRVSKIAALWFANKHPEILQLRDLDKLAEKIKQLYQGYNLIREQLIAIEAEFKALKPSSDFKDFNAYKRQLILDVLKLSTDLLVSGTDFIRFFADEADMSNINGKIFTYSRQAQSAIEAWFLIEDKEFAKAIALLLPLIPDLSPKTLEEIKGIPFKGRINTDDFKKDFNYLKDNQAAIQLIISGSVGSFTNVKDAQAYLQENKITFLEKLLIRGAGTCYAVSLPSGMTVSDVINFYEKVEKKLNDSKRYSMDYYETFFSKLSGSSYLTLTLFQYVNFGEFNGEAKKLIAVAGEVSTAKTAEEVKNALSKYSLPVASYRIKRNEPDTWTINAYTGVGYSNYGPLDFNNVEPILFAPIGIEYSFLPRKKQSRRMSISLLASVFDVGNVINYRLNTKGNTEKRVFTIENIISPGGFLCWGLSKKVPLAILAGYQFNPNRLTAALTFDLPLFRIR
jgi:hypothetical protein